MVETFQASAEKFGAEVEIESTRAYDAFVIAEDDAHVLKIKEVFAANGIEANTKHTGGGSDANNFNEKGLTTVNLSTGMSKVHTTEEFIAVEDMVKITDFVISYVTA
ncbi:peptidase M20A family [Vibrio variabilis]|uniref:Peptidase M20A family n=2 Tax=Vibrio TaxID=662 RepID=A0ABQ0JFX4_9VIBR|nr:peptidase M20A family [Vibrio variabilis]